MSGGDVSDHHFSLMGSLRRARASRTLAAIGSGNAAMLMLGLLSGIIAARLLGPHARGEFVATYTLTTVAAMFLTFGMSQAVVTYPGKESDVSGPLILQSVLSGLVGGVMCLGLAATDVQPWLDTAGILGGAFITAAGVVSSLGAGLAQRRGSMVREFQYVRVAPQAAVPIGMGLLALTGNRDPNDWLLVVGIAYLAPGVGILWWMLGLRPTFTRLRPTPEFLKDAVTAFTLVIGSGLIFRLDSVAVAIWLQPTEVALYAVAIAASNAASGIGKSVGMLTFSELPDVAPGERVRRVRREVFRTFAITGVLAAIAVLFAPWLIWLAYGEEFLGATAATRVAVIVAIPIAIEYLLIHALLVMQVRRRAFVVEVVSIVLFSGLLALTIPTGNLVLVALASMAGHTFAMVFLLLAVNHSVTTRDVLPSEPDSQLRAAP